MLRTKQSSTNQTMNSHMPLIALVRITKHKLFNNKLVFFTILIPYTGSYVFVNKESYNDVKVRAKAYLDQGSLVSNSAKANFLAARFSRMIFLKNY